MELRVFLKTLSVAEQVAFAIRCGTTIGYLRKGISVGARFGSALCIAIERESGGAVTCEELDPEADWAFLRAGQPSVAA